MEAEGDALTAAGLARAAGVPEAEIGRMVEAGVLVPRDGPAPFLLRDLHKLRLAVACERAGLPMDGIAAAIRAGRLSFAFMEASPYARWAVPSGRTYRQVSAETGVPLDDLRGALEAMGFAWLSPDEPMREDELEVVPLVRLAFSSGIFDRAWMTRVGRAYAEGLRLAAQVENESYRARFEGPVLRSGLGQRRAMELASELAAEFLPLVDQALMGIYRRQQELIWVEHQVLDVEAALAMVGQVPEAGLPPAHVGVAAGPVVVQGGDYFGRTVNLASRVAARAQAGQVLVTAPVAQAPSPGGVTYADLGELRLKGFTAPVRVLEARRA